MWAAIVGSRDLHDYDRFCKVMDFLKFGHSEEATERMRNIVGVVSGGANGVDKMAERWAKEQGLECRVFPAEWGHGRAAGPIRNKLIVDHLMVNSLTISDGFMIAMPKVNADGSYSRGTKNSIELAEKAGKRCYGVELK